MAYVPHLEAQYSDIRHRLATPMFSEAIGRTATKHWQPPRLLKIYYY
jgi:hypothetical protein